MRIVKLLLIIAVIGGLIYGTLRIMSPNPSGEGFRPDSPTLLQDMTDNVDRDWDDADEWNQEVYDKNISNADTYRKDLEDHSKGSYSTLLNYTNEKVCGKLVEFVDAEFSKSTCSRVEISKLKNALDYFVEKNGCISSSDIRLLSAYGKIKLYEDILAFGNSQFNLQPDFNISTNGWNDFESYRVRQLSRRDEFKGNRYYGTVSNVTDIKNSLGSVEARLSKARSNFENSLSQQIRSAYSSVERTQANMDKLQSAFNRYYSSYSDNNRLSNFRKDFKREVEAESITK